jgi:hypothetical protein
MRRWKMVWKDCGYVSLTKKKDSKMLSVVVKHHRYIIKLDEVRKVLSGNQAYTLIYKPPEKAEKGK